MSTPAAPLLGRAPQKRDTNVPNSTTASHPDQRPPKMPLHGRMEILCLRRAVRYYTATKSAGCPPTVTWKDLTVIMLQNCSRFCAILPQAKQIHTQPSINVNHHPDRRRDENHTIITMDAEKVLDKIQHPFRVKKYIQQGRERGFLSTIKV